MDHALSLGLPLRTFLARWMAEPRQSEMVRRLRRSRRGSSLRSRRPLDHPQRTAMLSAPRAFGRRARAGLKLGLHEVLLATHHALLAHGLGVQAIRGRARKKPLVGWAPVGWFCYPISDKPEDVEASRQATMQVQDGWNTCWYADPVILGRYPEDGLKAFGDAVPKFPASISKRCANRSTFWIQFLHRHSDAGWPRRRTGPSKTSAGLTPTPLSLEGDTGDSALGTEIHGRALQASDRHHREWHVELRLSCAGRPRP